jgi:hypothetical protein
MRSVPGAVATGSKRPTEATEPRPVGSGTKIQFSKTIPNVLLRIPLRLIG